MTSKVNIVGVVVAIVIALLAIGISLSHTPAPLAAGTSNYDTMAVTGLRVGSGCNDSFKTCTGSTVTQDNSGYCDLNFGTSTSAIAATSTVNVDCQATNMLASATANQAALTGVAAWSATSGGGLSLTAPTSTPTTFLGLKVNGVSASTTAGYITVSLTNQTGASLTPATTTAHLWSYRVNLAQ